MKEKSIFAKQFQAERNKIITKYYSKGSFLAKIDYIYYTALFHFYTYKVEQYFRKGAKERRLEEKKKVKKD